MHLNAFVLRKLTCMLDCRKTSQPGGMLSASWVYRCDSVCLYWVVFSRFFFLSGSFCLLSVFSFSQLASKMETLLLDKSFTALGGLQLSSQLRRFLQKLSLLHHSYYSAANQTSSFFPPLSGRNPFYEDGSSSSTAASHSSSSSSRNFLGALAAAASGGAGGRGISRGGGEEDDDGEDILSTVKIFCDTPIRPKVFFASISLQRKKSDTCRFYG